MKFIPKPDITSYELALIVAAFFHSMASGFTGGRGYSIIPKENWPDGVKRHFSEDER